MSGRLFRAAIAAVFVLAMSVVSVSAGQKPATTIDTPLDGAQVGGLVCVITGSTEAMASGAVMQLVEVSTDGGSNWNPARVTSSYTGGALIYWDFAWTLPGSGPYSIVCRGTDDKGNVESPGASINFTVAALPEAPLWGWGRNDTGQLGSGDTVTPRIAPVPCASPGGVVKARAGGLHSLVLLSDGTVWSFGYNNRGQLGYGTSDTDPHPDAAQVPGLSSVTDIATTDYSSAALKSDGTVWVWGGNSSGELANGATDSNPHPDPVQVAGLAGVTEIAGGNGFLLALKLDGTIWAWGSNSLCQLGMGSASAAYTSPAQVPGLAGVVAVYAGENSSGARFADGSLRTWGYNGHRQLGTGGSTSPVTSPTPVNGLTGVVSFDISNNNSAAVLSDGTVWVCGYNSKGQLGQGTYDLNDYSTMQQVPGLAGYTEVECGWDYVVAVRSDGTLWSWGSNLSGRLGQGSSDSLEHPFPTPVSGLGVVKSVEVTGEDVFCLTATTPPTSAITSPSDSETVGGTTYDITGTTSDSAGLGVGLVEVSTDGGLTWSAATDTSGDGSWSTWAYTWTLPVNGAYNILTRAYNKTGDMEAAGTGISVTVYNYSPLSTISSPAGGTELKGASAVVSGVASAGAGVTVVEVSWDGGSNWHAATDMSGNGSWSTWSYTWTLPANGAYTLISRVTDMLAAQETLGAGVNVTVNNLHLLSVALSIPDKATVQFSPVHPGDIYSDGETVWITVTPDTGYEFTGWSGDASGTDNPLMLTMDSDKSVTAQISAIPQHLTVTVNPPGAATISYNPAMPGLDYVYDDIVEVTVTPKSGYTFDDWTGDATGTANPVTILMDSGKSVTANLHFVPAKQQWVYLAGITGPVADVVVSPDFANDRTIFAAAGNYVYRSTDGGTSWSAVYSGSPMKRLQISPDYANDSVVFAQATPLIYRSGNGGNTWAVVNSASEYLDVSPDFATDHIAYSWSTCGCQSIYKSTNGGNTFTDTRVYVSGSVIGTAPGYSGSWVYLTVVNSMYRSVNGGSSFGQINVPGPSEYWFSPNFASDHTMFVSSGSGLLKSVNDGASWAGTVLGGFNPTMAVSPNFPTDQTLYASNSNVVMKSVDGGASSVPLDEFGISDNVLSLVMSADGNYVFAGTDDGVYMYAYPTLPESSITSPSEGSVLAVGLHTVTGTATDNSGTGIQKVEVSTDGGSTWNLASGTVSWSYSWSPASDGTYNIRSRATANDLQAENPGPGIAVTVDSRPPVSAITAPSDGAVIPYTEYTVTGTATEPTGIGMQKVEVSFDWGESWVLATDTSGNGSWTTWSYNWTPTSGGSFPMVSKATSNNLVVEVVGEGINVTVDATPPSSSVTSPSDGSPINGSAYNITGTADDGTGAGVVLVEVSTDGGNNWYPATGSTAWTYSWTLPADGVYTVQSRASDGGSVEVPGAGVSVTVDNTPPASSVSDAQVAVHDGFGPWADFPLIAGPNTVLYGDFNGDGNTDLAALNCGADSVSVLPGNGDGTFQPQLVTSTGVARTSVTSGQFDADGILDIAVANSDGLSVKILTGNGDGTFTDDGDYPVGDMSYFVTASEINNDGAVDLIVASNNTSGAVWVLAGNGDGTFQTYAEYFAAEGPSCAAVADLDGNGYKDIATANWGSGSISVLLNDGTGAFPAHVEYQAGTGPNFIVAADFDGDGAMDLAAADTNDDVVSVFMGNGDGTFQPRADFPVGTSPRSVCAGDIDGDGRVDIIASNVDSNDVSVLKGNGDGTFAPKTDHPVGLWPRNAKLCDLDADGMLDIAVANYDDGDMSVLLYGRVVSISSTGTASDGLSGVSQVEVSIDGGPWEPANGTGSWSHQWAMLDVPGGDYTVRSRATDAAGNVETPGTGITAPVDVTDPSSTITYPADSAVLSGMVSITGTATDGAGSGVSLVEVSTDGGTSWTAASTSDGWATWSYDWDTFTEPDGAYSIMSRATDGAGLVETPGAGVGVNVDNTPPVSTVNYPFERAILTGADCTITGGAVDAAGSSVTLVEVSTDNGSTWNTATGTASWSYVWTLPADGPRTIKVRATDSLGNTDSPLYGVRVAVHNDPPAVKGSWTIDRPDGGLVESVWTTAMAVDGSGAAHICYNGGYVTTYGINYLTNGSGQWVSTRLETSEPVYNLGDMVLDSSGKAHVAYLGAVYPPGWPPSGGPEFGPNIYDVDLWYATNETGSWVHTKVDGNWGGDEFSTFGCSIALDASGKAHISYQNNGSLKYATNSAGSWGTYDIAGVGTVGQNNSIAADASGKAHISYYDSVTQTLKYATNKTGTWASAVVASGFETGVRNSITTDVSGFAHIGYHDNATSSMMYATNKAGSWLTESVGGSGDSGWWYHWDDIVVDTQGNVHISYNNHSANSSSSLVRTTNRTGYWVTETVESANLGYGSSVALDQDGFAHISYCDYAGSDSIKYAYESDVTPPVSSITDPADGVVLSGTGITISGTSTDNLTGVALVEISTDGGNNWSPATGTMSWSYGWALPADGAYTVLSRSTDGAGNVETPGTGATVTVDNTPPSSTITSPADSAAVSGIVSITGTATDGAGSGVSLVEVSMDGGANWTAASTTNGWATWSYGWDTTAEPDGAYSIMCRATDGAGLVETPGAGVGVMVSNDPIPPAVSISSPSDGDRFTDPVLTVTGTASDNDAVVIVEVSVDGGPWSPAADTSGGSWATWSYDWSAPGLGTYALSARAKDGSGNSSADTVKVFFESATADPEQTHNAWDAWLSGGCVDCHATRDTFLSADLMESPGFCSSCHNPAAPAHDKSLTGGVRHPVFVNASSGGTLFPTYGNLTGMAEDNRPYANLVDGKVVCVTCHNVMGKPEDYGRDWELTTTADNQTYTLANGGWAFKGYIVPKVYRDTSLWSGPSYAKDRKDYLVSPAEYSYNGVSGTVTFGVAQDPTVYIYVTLDFPYLRAGSENNRLCADCHDQAAHFGINCLDCHDMHGTDNIRLVRGKIRVSLTSEPVIVFTGYTGANSLADGDGVYDGICEVCHTFTAYHRSDGTGAPHNGGSDCTSCHPHSAGFPRWHN